MSKKQIIAVDIDEVLSPLHDLVFAHHNAVYGTNYPARDPSGKYFLQEFSGDSNEEIREKLKKFVDSEAFRNVRPLQGAVEAVGELARSFELIVITSRQDFYETITRHWLEQHFPRTFSQVHFTEYIINEGPKRPKAELCLELGATHLIDDNLQYVEEAVRAGLKAILFGDYPWNKTDSLPAGIVRCRDWTEVLEYFNERS